MRILLTGMTGYLGSNLAAELITKGHELIGLKRRTSSIDRIEKILPNLKLHNIEDLDLAKIFTQYGKIDVVIHTATSYGRNNEGINDVINANMSFPVQLLDQAIHSNVSTFINADTSLDKMLNIYALSKSQFTDWGRYLSKKQKISFINLKIEHFYGPGDDKSKFIAHVVKTCMRNDLELNLTRGEQLRDFIYIDDLLSAFMIFIDKKDIFENGFFEFDVGCGEAIQLKSIVEIVHRLTESKTKLNFGALPYRQGEAMLSEADTTNLKSMGWKCCYNIETGLKKLIKHEKEAL